MRIRGRFSFVCLPVVIAALVGLSFAKNSSAAASFAAAGPDARAAVAEFSCTGAAHARAITLWERVGRPYFAQQIVDGLNKGGNVYVLYDTQEEMQPFVEMTRRCKDTRQIDEIAATLNPALSSLRPIPGAPGVLGWVCTGGPICTPANRLLGKEVQLASTQFLGLVGAVATDIVENVPAGHRTPAESAFLARAPSAMATQVNHWLSSPYFAQVANRMRMRPSDATDGTYRYFFVELDLWPMATLSDLSELYEAGVKFDGAGVEALHALQDKDRAIASMFNLFLRRVTVIEASNGPRAVVDRGYWRNLSDDRYALYSGEESPVLCQADSSGKVQKILRVPPRTSYIDPEIGWDVSHARRLVPALATFVRNRENLDKVFEYSNVEFDPASLRRAFAEQIVAKIWNHDDRYPLFSNFWDGSNGWYRVGYENGTGECRTGTPPYGLGWSIPTGGYLRWGAVNDTLRAVGVRLYELLDAQDAQSRAFLTEFYPELAAGGPAGNTMSNVWRLTILSSLIE